MNQGKEREALVQSHFNAGTASQTMAQLKLTLGQQ